MARTRREGGLVAHVSANGRFRTFSSNFGQRELLKALCKVEDFSVIWSLLKSPLKEGGKEGKVSRSVLYTFVRIGGIGLKGPVPRCWANS